jgi:hypothetical protein
VPRGGSERRSSWNASAIGRPKCELRITRVARPSVKSRRMSYVIHLWEHPAPLTIQQAEAQHQALAGKPSPPNPKWKLVAECVEARMEELGEPLEEWPEDSPPDADHAERTYPLLIPGQDTFLEVVVEVATSLGLVVYDDQAARVYLPFGYVILGDKSGRMSKAPPKLVAADLERVVAQCEQAWAPRFKQLGFDLQPRPAEPPNRHNEIIAERTVESGRQQITVSFTQIDDSLFFDVTACQFFELPADARQAANGIDRVEIRGNEFRGLAALMKDRMTELATSGQLRFQMHVDWLVTSLFDYYEQEIRSTFDAMRDTAAVVRIASGEQTAPGYLRCSRETLALAWTQGDAALERVMARARVDDPQWAQDWGQAICDELRKLPRVA